MREVKKNTEEMSRKKSHYLYMRSVNRVNASAMNWQRLRQSLLEGGGEMQ
jgi:hypothetical protein